MLFLFFLSPLLLGLMMNSPATHWRSCWMKSQRLTCTYLLSIAYFYWVIYCGLTWEPPRWTHCAEGPRCETGPRCAEGPCCAVCPLWCQGHFPCYWGQRWDGRLWGDCVRSMPTITPVPLSVHGVEFRQYYCPCFFPPVSLPSTLHRLRDSQVGCGEGAQPSNPRRAGLSLTPPCLHLCPRRLQGNNDMFTLRQSRKSHTLLFRYQLIWKDLEFDSLALCPATVSLVE